MLQLPFIQRLFLFMPRTAKWTKQDPQDSFKRVFLIQLPECRYSAIPELVKLFKDEQTIFRVIIAGYDGEHYNTTCFDYYQTDKTEAEYERLHKMFHSHFFPNKQE